jgi:hypothetical protein
MPGQLQLDEELTAEGNLHIGIQKKPPTASAGAKSNSMTMHTSNLLSEKESKMEMQTTRWGHLPLM